MPLQSTITQAIRNGAELKAASNTADLFYQLFNTFTTLAIIVGVVVLGLMAYLVVRFRAKDSSPEPDDSPRLGRVPQSRGHLKNILVSVTLSSIVVVVLILGSLSVTDQITNIPAECARIPSPCLTIQVTAYRFGWNFTYPNGQTLVSNLTIPTGRIVILNIVSKDVFHSFGIESFKIKKDAIPGLPHSNKIWFEANDQGLKLDDIRCFELCGVGHAGMKAHLTSVSSGGFSGFCSASSGC